MFTTKTAGTYSYRYVLKLVIVSNYYDGYLEKEDSVIQVIRQLVSHLVTLSVGRNCFNKMLACISPRDTL